MDPTISENKPKHKYKILIGISLLLVFGVSYYGYNYIYSNQMYLMEHSKNLQNGSGVEKCRYSKSSGFISTGDKYICDNGYYQVSYPTHKRIFYYEFSSNQLGGSARTDFLENVDSATFKVLNRNYAIDKNNLYNLGQVEHVQDLDLNSVSAINNYYLKDNNSVFAYSYVESRDYVDGKAKSGKLSGVNPNDFKIVNVKYPEKYTPPQPSPDLPHEDSPFGMSENNLFNGEHIIKAFQVNDSGEKNEVSIDVPSFEILRTQLYLYAKDKNHVYFLVPGEYWGGTNFEGFYVVNGADPKTFSVERNYPDGSNTVGLDNVFDANGKYDKGCKILLPQGAFMDKGGICKYF